MESDIKNILIKKAGSLLARRAYSRGELKRRLLHGRFPNRIAEQDVEAALDHLDQLNLLNDAEYAYNFAFYRINRDGWGASKVYDFLISRLVAPSTIDAALQRVCSEVDEEAALADYLEKHFSRKKPPTKPREIRKLKTRLHSRGFSEESIQRELRRFIPTAALRRFETGE